MNTICKPKFNLGQVVATPGALEALEESGQTPQFFLEKHQRGDWGHWTSRISKPMTKPWSTEAAF